MAFTEISDSGATNSTSNVTVVSAPASSTRRVVRNITVYNADTVSAIVFIIYNNNGTQRTIVKQSIAAGETLAYTDILILDSTLKKIDVKLNSAITTNQLDWTTHYADVT